MLRIFTILLMLAISINSFSNKKMEILSSEYFDKPIINVTDYGLSYVPEVARILGISGDTRIVINYIPEGRATAANGRVVDGFVQGYGSFQYNIYIRKGASATAAKKLITHELTHVKQMQDGDLVQNTFSDVSWRGKKVDLSSFGSVRLFPHEIDARNKVSYIKKSIKQNKKK